MRPALSRVLVMAAILGATCPAWADAGALPPDIVRLKDGGMVRGTILELVANAAVTIQLPNGETRTFTLTDTTYAGPASGDNTGRSPQGSGDPWGIDEPRRTDGTKAIPAAGPGATVATPASAAGPGATVAAPASDSGAATTQPYVTVHAARARLKLVGDSPNLTYHLQTEVATASAGFMSSTFTAVGYQKLCTAPCAIDLPEGRHRFALSSADQSPVGSDLDVDVHGDVTVHGEIESSAGLRRGAITLMVLGGLAGAGLLAGGFYTLSAMTTDSSGFPQSTYDPALGIGLAVGGGVLLGGSILSGVFMLRAARDEAHFRITPGISSAGTPRWFPREQTAAGTPLGLTATYAF